MIWKPILRVAIRSETGSCGVIITTVRRSATTLFSPLIGNVACRYFGEPLVLSLRRWLSQQGAVIGECAFGLSGQRPGVMDQVGEFVGGEIRAGGMRAAGHAERQTPVDDLGIAAALSGSRIRSRGGVGRRRSSNRVTSLAPPPSSPWHDWQFC